MTGNKQILTILIVSGTVQGVFFRAKTKKHADQLGLKGYVKNLSDGTVEIGVVGKESSTLVGLLKSEPLPIEINTISFSSRPLDREYHDFSVS